MLLACLASAGCVAQPHKARVRNEAGYRLVECLRFAGNPYRGEAARRACLDEVADYCRSQGLEATCGLGDAWTAHRS